MVLLTILYFIVLYTVISYSIWKELRGEYLNSQIFNFSFWISLSAILGSLSVYFLISEAYWFWGGVIALFGSFFYFTKKLGLKKVETIDSLVRGLIVSMVFVLLINYFVTFDNYQNLFLGITLFLINLIHGFFKQNYKKFNWYKSGRIGIAGSLTISLFFFIRFVISIFLSRDMITFSKGGFETYISLGIFVLSLYNVFKLAQK